MEAQKTMTLGEALEDVDIAFLQLEFSLKLLTFCELEKIDPAEFDTDLTVVLEDGNLPYPSGHFSDPGNIVRAAGVSVSLAAGASALVLDKAWEAAGVAPDPTSQDQSVQLRTVVYMIRCAYAHGIAEPRWEVRGNFRRAFELRLPDGPVTLDLRALDERRFDFDHLDGYRTWFAMRDATLGTLRPMSAPPSE